MSSLGDFVKNISESDAAKVLGAAEKIGGYATLLFSLFQEDDTTRILNRIDLLEQAIADGLNEVGDLISRQTSRILERLDELANTQAVAHARTALNQLFQYKQTNDNAKLNNADRDSTLAVELLKPQTDPFFLGGLACAGTVRIDVLRALDPEFFRNPLHVGQINGFADEFAGMLETARRAAIASHIISYGTATFTRLGPHGDPIEDAVDYVAHEQLTRDPSNPLLFRSTVLKSYPYDAPHGPGQRSREEAEALAHGNREAGIQAELAYLSIPRFESLLATWRNLATGNA